MTPVGAPPTKRGHVWQCTGCEHRGHDMDAAAAHADESGHMLVEVERDRDVGQTGWVGRGDRKLYRWEGRIEITDNRKRRHAA